MTAIIQRPLRGSRISAFYPIKNLPSLSSLDSAFQLQEYISLLIRLNVHDVNSIVSLPGNPSAKDKEKEVEVGFEKKGTEGEKDVDVVEKGKAESTVDEACWIYEQLRRLAQDLSHPLITTLQQECTRASCPEMKAGEWLYLCVAHGNDGSMERCCAIDYILHTVDSATALLNSPRTFPSRLQIPVASHRHFSSLARRLGRIFAHAYFHHREAFEQAEAESSLYARFLTLTDRFDLVPAEFLVIPTDDHNIGTAGDPMGLGPSPSSSPRDEHRRPNESDRSYHHHQQQQQQRTQYDLDLANLHHGSEHQLHPSLPERNPSPPGPSSSESSSGGIGESPSPPSRPRFGRNRTGTMVFAEAEANVVTDELARSSLREREREPQKIELLEGDGEPVPFKVVIPAAEEEDVQFEISLGPEAEKYVVGARSVEMEKEVTPDSTSDVVADQPKEGLGEPAASVEPATSTEIKSDDGPQTQLLPTETTTNSLPADDNVSILEPTLIPTEMPETVVTNLGVATKPDDKETIPLSILEDGELPTAVSNVPTILVIIPVETPIVESKVETALEPEPEDLIKIKPTPEDDVPADPTQEVSVDADKHTVVSSPDVGSVATKKEDKSSVAVDDTAEVMTGETKTQLTG